MLDKKTIEDSVFGRKTTIEAGETFIVIALIEIREAFDRYIDYQIKSDKVLEGVLKDIYSAVRELGSQN